MASDVCQDAIRCELDFAGGICIVASIMWLLTGGATLFLKARPRPPLIAISALPPNIIHRESEDESPEPVTPSTMIT
jgi:hypothetical protein